jgi:hypothetical protein
MHVSELRKLLDALEAQGITDIRADDDFYCTNEKFFVKRVFVDERGAIVDAIRRQCVEREPYNRDIYHDVFLEDSNWQERYDDFDAFYNFMENARIEELRLVDGAKEVALITTLDR